MRDRTNTRLTESKRSIPTGKQSGVFRTYFLTGKERSVLYGYAMRVVYLPSTSRMCWRTRLSNEEQEAFQRGAASGRCEVLNGRSETNCFPILQNITKHDIIQLYNFLSHICLPPQAAFHREAEFSPAFHWDTRCCKNLNEECEDCTRKYYEKKAIRTEIAQLATMDFPLRSCFNSRGLSDG